MGLFPFKLICKSFVLGISVKVPLSFQGKTLKYGNLRLSTKIFIFQEGSILVSKTNGDYTF